MYISNEKYALKIYTFLVMKFLNDLKYRPLKLYMHVTFN